MNTLTKSGPKRGRKEGKNKGGAPEPQPRQGRQGKDPRPQGGQRKNRFSVGLKPRLHLLALEVSSSRALQRNGEGSVTNKVEILSGERCLLAVANRPVAGVLVQPIHPKNLENHSSTKLCGNSVKVRGYVNAPP